MQKWEYKIEDIMIVEDFSDLPFAPTSWPSPEIDKDKLRQFGEDGWELISVNNDIAIFKRLIDEAARNRKRMAWSEEKGWYLKEPNEFTSVGKPLD